MNSLRDAFVQEFRLCQRFLRSHDLAEGVRAQVIDKDRSPQWSPSRLEDVAPDHVLRFLEPPTDHDHPDLRFPSGQFGAAGDRRPGTGRGRG